jgi:hypothetical protein
VSEKPVTARLVVQGRVAAPGLAPVEATETATKAARLANALIMANRVALALAMSVGARAPD